MERETSYGISEFFAGQPLIVLEYFITLPDGDVRNARIFSDGLRPLWFSPVDPTKEVRFILKLFKITVRQQTNSLQTEYVNTLYPVFVTLHVFAYYVLVTLIETFESYERPYCRIIY